MNVQPSALIGQQGVSLVSLQIARDLGWIVREQFTADYGIDVQIEIVADGQATWRLLAAQIKAGSSWFKEPNAAGWVFRPHPGHVQYWTAHSLPVLIVLVDVEAEMAYWQIVTKEQLTSTGAGWKITIPEDQVLSSASKDALSEIAEGEPYELRLRQLQLARPWMSHLSEGGRITIEMEEWVNKTSGRASIQLIAHDGDGEVVAERAWPLIFPFANYSVELPRLFPWAALSVDVDSDDLHDQYLAECGHWDSEDETYFYSMSFADWLDSSRRSDGLHSVDENGEVAYWRLDAGLSELGRAFLTADAWLSQDQLPPLA